MSRLLEKVEVLTAPTSHGLQCKINQFALKNNNDIYVEEMFFSTTTAFLSSEERHKVIEYSVLIWYRNI